MTDHKVLLTIIIIEWPLILLDPPPDVLPKGLVPEAPIFCHWRAINSEPYSDGSPKIVKNFAQSRKKIIASL